MCVYLYTRIDEATARRTLIGSERRRRNFSLIHVRVLSRLLSYTRSSSRGFLAYLYFIYTSPIVVCISAIYSSTLAYLHV